MPCSALTPRCSGQIILVRGPNEAAVAFAARQKQWRDWTLAKVRSLVQASSELEFNVGCAEMQDICTAVGPEWIDYFKKQWWGTRSRWSRAFRTVSFTLSIFVYLRFKTLP